jgi:hypothetical protein
VPRLDGRQHVILRAEHFGALSVAVDLQAYFPAEMMRPPLAHGDELLLLVHLAGSKQIAEVRRLAVPVLALKGGGHGRGIVARRARLNGVLSAATNSPERSPPRASPRPS